MTAIPSESETMPENTSAPNIDIDTIRVKTETRTPTPTALVSPNHKDAGSTNDNDIIHETKLNAKDTNQQEDTSCNRTECETPVSSPEQEMVVTRKMKQEQLNTMSTRTSFTDTDTDDSAHERADTGAVKSTDASDSGAEADKDKDPKETQEKKDIDFSNWPTENVKDPCINDVLYGRGGGTNHHEGNKRYRKMVESRKVDYVNSKRLDKPLVALDIIRLWRGQSPPGRFLKYDDKTDLWSDVGDKKAREKTSQALREKAPLLRKQQEEQIMEALGQTEDDADTDACPLNSSSMNRGGKGSPGKRNVNPKLETKQTRFDVPVSQTTNPNKKLGRAMLARDHSLGVDYMCSNEPMSIKGFSWDANDVDPPIPNPPDDAPGAQGWGRSRNQVPPLHRPNQYYGEYYSHPPGPGVNGPSTSSVPMSIASMPREQSLAGNPLALASTAESASTGSFEEPKSKSQYPTTPMHAVNQWQQHPAAYQRSSASHSDEKVQEAWAKRRYGDGDQGDYRQTRSADHNYRSSGASTNTNMDYKANQWHSGNDRNLGYDAQYNNGGPSNEYMNRWDEYRNGYHYPPDGRVSHADAMYNHSHAGQQQWVTSPNRYSSTQGSYPTHPGHPRSPSQPHQQHHATNYTNSADNGSYTTSGNHQQFDQTYPDAIPKHHSPLRRTGLDFESPNESESSCSPSRSIPRPQAIKRDTSNQNENYETKSQIKRMNRQRSIGSKRQSSMSSLGKVSENDMHNLGRHLRQSSIGINDNVPDMHPLEKPNRIGLHDRKLTIDQFDLGDHIEGKSSPLDEVKSDRPKPIAYSNRGTSLESIKLDEVLGIMSKPAGLGDSDRLGTLGTLDSNDFDTAKVAI